VIIVENISGQMLRWTTFSASLTSARAAAAPIHGIGKLSRKWLAFRRMCEEGKLPVAGSHGKSVSRAIRI
jgi:hypothetical protein